MPYSYTHTVWRAEPKKGGNLHTQAVNIKKLTLKEERRETFAFISCSAWLYSTVYGMAVQGKNFFPCHKRNFYSLHVFSTFFTLLMCYVLLWRRRSSSKGMSFLLLCMRTSYMKYKMISSYALYLVQSHSFLVTSWRLFLFENDRLWLGLVNCGGKNMINGIFLGIAGNCLKTSRKN